MHKSQTTDTVKKEEEKTAENDEKSKPFIVENNRLKRPPSPSWVKQIENEYKIEWDEEQEKKLTRHRDGQRRSRKTTITNKVYKIDILLHNAVPRTKTEDKYIDRKDDLPLTCVRRFKVSLPNHKTIRARAMCKKTDETNLFAL